MQLYIDKKECYGCGACANACKLDALKMIADEEGFAYPYIDEKKCIECGQCKKVCQIHNLKMNNEEPLIYAAKNKDEKVRSVSTSGGMFSVFANSIVGRGGVVYGVAYDENFNAVHKRAETVEEYQQFLGSKYVQSSVGDCYQQVKRDLDNNKEVLFTGTPCQIAGLSTYLGESSKKENLLLCEIICHGIPSPLMWQEHLKLIEKTRKSKVINYKNRSKVAGWHGHNEHFFLENGKDEYKTKLAQNHKDLFYAHLIIRPSCYSCAYAGFPRMADISIADYWGIELCMKDFDDNKGTSLLILNNEKGKKFFDRIKEQIEYRESNVEDAFRDNHKRPAKMNVNRDKFWEDYYKNGYLYVLKKYSAYTRWGRFKRWLKIKMKIVCKKIGLYNFLHKFTQKKYKQETYK